MRMTKQIGLDLTKNQERYLDWCAGAARFSYNWALTNCDNYTGGRHVLRDEFTKLKNTTYTWLENLPAKILSETVRILEQYIRLWKHNQAPKPRFRKKSDNPYFVVGSDTCWIKDGYLKFPKLGKVRLCHVPNIVGKPLSFSFVKHERWYINYSYDTPVPPRTTSTKCVGVELNFQNLAVLRDDDKTFVYSGMESIKKANRKFLVQRRKCRRKQINSKNYHKAQRRIRKLKAKLYHCRKDAIHKLTSFIATNYKYVCTRNPQSFKLPPNPTQDQMLLSRNWIVFFHLLKYKMWMRFVVNVPVELDSVAAYRCGNCECINREYNTRVQFVKCKSCRKKYNRHTNAAENWYSRALGYRAHDCEGTPTPDEAVNGLEPYTTDPKPLS